MSDEHNTILCPTLIGWEELNPRRLFIYLEGWLVFQQCTGMLWKVWFMCMSENFFFSRDKLASILKRSCYSFYQNCWLLVWLYHDGHHDVKNGLDIGTVVNSGSSNVCYDTKGNNRPPWSYGEGQMFPLLFWWAKFKCLWEETTGHPICHASLVVIFTTLSLNIMLLR